MSAPQFFVSAVTEKTDPKTLKTSWIVTAALVTSADALRGQVQYETNTKPDFGSGVLMNFTTAPVPPAATPAKPAATN